MQGLGISFRQAVAIYSVHRETVRCSDNIYLGWLRQLHRCWPIKESMANVAGTMYIFVRSWHTTESNILIAKHLCVVFKHLYLLLTWINGDIFKYCILTIWKTNEWSHLLLNIFIQLLQQMKTIKMASSALKNHILLNTAKSYYNNVCIEVKI